MERKTIQQVMVEQEKERNRIGTELHENFAQVVAAISLYIDMAGQMDDLQMAFLKKAKDETSRLLAAMRNLSKDIVPTTLRNATLASMIQDYIQRFSLLVPFSIEFAYNGARQVEGEMAISMFRVIEQRLHMLSVMNRVTHVFVDVAVKKAEMVLTINDDGLDEEKIHDSEVLMNSISKRIELYKGRIDRSACSKKGNTMKIILPFLSVCNTAAVCS